MKDARRALAYATSLAIDLLHELDIARAQLETLTPKEDGRMVVIPGNALPLSAAVTNAHLAIRSIRKKP